MIETQRLVLRPADPASLRAAIEGRHALAGALAARVPDTWPPEYVNEAALEYTIERLTETEGRNDWWLYFILLRDEGATSTLVGTAGFKGPASADGVVEVGYSVVREYHRRGIASEATIALLEFAFQAPDVRSVIAETIPALEPSIGVLNKVGFRFVGQGSEDGVIRFDMTRSSFFEQYGA